MYLMNMNNRIIIIKLRKNQNLEERRRRVGFFRKILIIRLNYIGLSWILNSLCHYVYHIYIRTSKYLKMPYKLLHRALSMKLHHKLLLNQERNFVFHQLRLFDELCYLDTLCKLWQNCYDIGVQHHTWPVSWMKIKNHYIIRRSYYDIFLESSQTNVDNSSKWFHTTVCWWTDLSDTTSS